MHGSCAPLLGQERGRGLVGPRPCRDKQGHRICVEITSLDVGTGVGSATNVEYIPYHICSGKTVLHKIYHDPRHPSHLLLPVIPNG